MHRSVKEIVKANADQNKQAIKADIAAWRQALQKASVNSLDMYYKLIGSQLRYIDSITLMMQDLSRMSGLSNEQIFEIVQSSPYPYSLEDAYHFFSKYSRFPKKEEIPMIHHLLILPF